MMSEVARKAFDVVWARAPPSVEYLQAASAMPGVCVRSGYFRDNRAELAALRAINAAQPPAARKDTLDAYEHAELDDLCLQHLGHLPNLTGLRLNGVTSLPAAFPAITHLTLYECQQLTALPPEIGQLCTLKSLEVVGCDKLTTLTPGLGRLPALHVLRLYHNVELTGGGLRAGLEDCARLKELKVIHFPAQHAIQLPDEGAFWGSLEHLYLSGCIAEGDAGCFNRALKQIGRKEPRLKTLHLAHLRAEADEDPFEEEKAETNPFRVLHWVMTFSPLQETLETLEIIDCWEYNAIDQHFLMGLKDMKRLRNLDLHTRHDVSDWCYAKSMMGYFADEFAVPPTLERLHLCIPIRGAPVPEFVRAMTEHALHVELALAGSSPSTIEELFKEHAEEIRAAFASGPPDIPATLNPPRPSTGPWVTLVLDRPTTADRWQIKLKRFPPRDDWTVGYKDKYYDGVDW